MAAWCAAGVVNLVVITLIVPLPTGGISVRIVHHLYDAGHMVAMGLASAGAVAAWQRWGLRRAAWGYAALAVASIATGFALLPEDLFGFVQQADFDVSPDIGQVVATVIVALGVPAAALLGRALARRGALRLAGALVATALVAANHWLLPNDYPSAHFYLAAAAVALGTASLAGASWRPLLARPAATSSSAPPARPAWVPYRR